MGNADTSLTKKMTSYEDKELLLSRSQELDYVDDVTDFQCVRCKRVLIRHYIANCGHKFCLNCKKLLGDGSKRWRCPIKECNKFIENIDRQDFEFEQKVFELRAHCPNHKYGCPYVGPLERVVEHLKICTDTRERALPVQYYRSGAGTDPEFNFTLMVMQREIHKVKRELAELKMKVNEMEKKKQDKETRLMAQEVYNNIIKPEFGHLRRVSDYYKERENFIWVVKDIKNFINGSGKDLLSQVFPLANYPFGAQAKMALYDKSVWISLAYKDINRTNKPIQFQPFPVIYFTLKDQSRNKEAPADIVKSRYFRCRADNLEYNTFYDFQHVDKNALTSPPYNADDTVILHVHVEAPEVATMMYSNNGTITWVVDDFRKRKRMEVESLIESYLSPYFYTSLNGWRVQVKAHLNGYDEYKNQGLSVCIAFVNGLYDEVAIKADQFPHETTVTLFHPTQPARRISKTVDKDSSFWYVIDMASQAEIENLLFNDSLYYTVSVKAKNG